MLRHGGTWALDLSGAGLSQSGFFGLFNFFLRGMWLSFPPLVAAVLITPKGAESPGSGHIGVTGALVFFFHLRPFKINFTFPGQPSSALRH